MSRLWLYLAWVLGAGVLGLIISVVFADLLRLSRRVFLIPYIVLSASFLYAFYRWSGIDLGRLVADNWVWGLVAGIVVGAFLVRNILSQPPSARSTGVGLALDLLWVGLGYGIMDALLLNVMPAVAVLRAFAADGGPTGWPGRIAVGALALLASLLVALLYHLGYPEFRNRKVGLVLIGNGLITLAYLLSTNPLGALVSHATMHVAAVLRGPETMLQLPPHDATGQQAVSETG